VFRNRAEAGQFLADKLVAYADRQDTVVLGLPRGGVPVAFEVASRLNAPLDVFVVCKLGVPGQAELAMGATASGKIRVLNQEIIRALRISEEVVESVAAKEEREIERREVLYRGDRSQCRGRE
jgi:putative phosphoribosyl transferase